MTTTRRVGLLLLAALPAFGCALLAKKTPTPAANINSAELAATPPQPGVRHYLIVYGSEKNLVQPAYTHTWATVVTASDLPNCPEPAVYEETISWLPVQLPINARSRTVVPGRNYGLDETIKYMLDTKQDLAMWGPYEVWHGFAYRFRVQKGFLDSGAVGYQCIDTVGEAGRTGDGCDCIHSVTDMDPAYPRWGYPLFLYGQRASARLVRRVMHSPVTIGAPATHDWIIPRLGLDRYPIDRREYTGRVESYDPATGRAGLDQVDRVLRPAAPPVLKEKGLTVPPGGPAPKLVPVPKSGEPSEPAGPPQYLP